MGKKNILFITLFDPKNVRAASGTIYSMYLELEKTYNLHWIGEFQPSFSQNIRLLSWKILSKLKGGNPAKKNMKFFYKFYADRMNEKLNSFKDIDYIYTPVSSGLINYLDTKSIPIIYFSDATFKLMNNYYWFNQSPSVINECIEIEKTTLQKCAKLIFASDWAKQSAISDYGCVEEKIKVIPIPPNFSRIPNREEVINKAIPQELSLLFVGVDWKRKGGDILLNAYLKIQAMGVKCNLTIVGCTPDIDEKIEGVKIIPFLDKNKDEDRDTLINLYLRSSFFVLPTKAECFGIVFSEASSCGCPSISYNTGGVSNAITESKNGFLLPEGSGYEDFVNIILKTWNDKETYQQFIISSRDEYDNRLNWEYWGKEFNNLIKKLS